MTHDNHDAVQPGQQLVQVAADARKRSKGAREHALPPIQRPYLMVTFIPFYQDAQGDVWLERMWHRDFARHLEYLKCFTLLGPRYTLAQGKGLDLVKLEVPADVQLHFAGLPHQGSRLRALINAPRTVRTIWRQVGRTSIVHSGVAGWPYPVGWIANVSAHLRRKQLLIYVESAPWRAGQDNPRRSLLHRAQTALFEGAARWSVNRATISFYTHGAYRDSLLEAGKGPGFVLPASWINEDDVVDHARAKRSWRKKSKRVRPRFLYAARLTHEKGVEVLLGAVALLRQRGVELDIDVIGEGELSELCRDSAELPGSVRIKLQPPVSYEQLLSSIEDYNAVLVPNVSDEQPRIVFDAYSHAVPVIASDTVGLRPYVFAQRTGVLVPPADATGLADALERAAGDSAPLARMGEAALDYATTITHRQMHRERWRLMLQHMEV